jgi:hypothetical protein
MKSKEFILWLKGFTEGVHEYKNGVSPILWDIVKEKLVEVKDEPTPSFPTFTPQPAPIQTLPFIQPYNPKPIQTLPYITPGPSTDPYNPYKITSGTTCESGVILATTSGSNGTVTYNPSTTTLWNPSGSNWSYTNTLPTNKWDEHQAKMAGYKPYQPYTKGGEDEVIKKEE